MKSLDDFFGHTEERVTRLSMGDYLLAPSDSIYMIALCSLPSTDSGIVVLSNLADGGYRTSGQVDVSERYKITAQEAQLLGINHEWKLLSKQEAWKRLLSDNQH